MNFEEPENKNANIGQRSAIAYVIGPQYVDATPVNTINMNSVNLSTKIKMVSKDSIYVKNVFLSVFSHFKNLSKIFMFYSFQIVLIAYIYYPTK